LPHTYFQPLRNGEGVAPRGWNFNNLFLFQIPTFWHINKFSTLVICWVICVYFLNRVLGVLKRRENKKVRSQKKISAWFYVIRVKNYDKATPSYIILEEIFHHLPKSYQSLKIFIKLFLKKFASNWYRSGRCASNDLQFNATKLIEFMANSNWQLRPVFPKLCATAQ
jgi:hypothetical protein